jgi:hypothetical protein
MEIRNYSANDETKILQLFETVFKKPLSTEAWNWRFAHNPVGKFMIKLMWDGDILAGHYAVSPLFMRIGNDRLLSSLSMTTMTHPDYGGRGIFSELAETLYQEEFQQNGLSSIWGFPNTNSHYGFIKNLGWKDLAVIPMLSVSPTALKPGNDEVQLSSIQGFDEQHFAISESLTSAYPVRTERSAEYLNWRYVQNPDHTYYIFDVIAGSQTGFVVCKIIPAFSRKDAFELDLMELMLPPDFKIISAVLQNLVATFHAFPLSKINCWLPLHDPKHILLEKIGFQQGLPLTYLGARIMSPRFELMSDPRNWFLSMGDSDVY